MKWMKTLGFSLGVVALAFTPLLFGQKGREASPQEKQTLRNFERKEAAAAKKAFKKSHAGMRYLSKLPAEAISLSSIHYFNASYPKDFSLDIEDGCQFTVRESDMPCLSSWRRGAPLRISPSHSWFSSYDWYVTNIDRDEWVKAKLTRGPFENSPFNKHIVAIDLASGLINLDNGMTFQIYDSLLEREELKKWQNSDVILIVNNNGWFSWGYKNILINLMRDQYVRAVRIN
jgi:hypothetical protein